MVPILLLFVSDFKKALIDQADFVYKMGGYHYIISNFKEGGTSEEPWCELLFTFINAEGFVYRRGT